MTVDPRSSYDEAGLFIRAKDNADRGYKLELNALKRMVLLHNLRIEGVTGLDKKLTLDIVVREDMIDVWHRAAAGAWSTGCPNPRDGTCSFS